MNNKIMPKMGTCVAGVLAAFVLCNAVLADRGAIVPVGDVNIEEPAQRAIIAHNGVREILILQTDVKADKETKVVEFMPLPSKPEVSLAQEGCFAALQEIVKAHDLRYVVRYRGKNGRGADGGESVKVVVAEQLGPHAVTVVEVEDAEAFMTWVREFFAENDLGEPALGDELQRIVADYLDQESRFFAFDIVTLSPEQKTVQPLTYDFRTDDLYYPLKVTNLYGGSGIVELLTLLPDGVSVHRQISIRPVVRRGKTPLAHKMGMLRSTSARPDAAEIARLHAGLPAFMGNEATTLQAVKYEGPLRFQQDVRIPVFHSDPERLCRRFLAALETGDAETVEALTSVPFAYDRKKVILNEKELMAEFQKFFEETRGTSLQPEAISRVEDKLPSEFDRNFVRNFLVKERRPNIYRCTIRGEEVLLFLRRGPHGGYRVAGFSD